MIGLNVPLTVRIGDKHVTAKVSDISFRREAVGGVRNITLNLLRDIDSLDADLAPFTKVYIYDGRTATTVAEGRLSDSGRSADASGQAWDIVAFGPVQHASDITSALIYVDRNVSDAFQQIAITQPSISVNYSARPGDTSTVPVSGVLVAMPQGLTINAGSNGTAHYNRVRETGQKLARVYSAWNAGLTDAAVRIQTFVRTNGGAATFIQDTPADTVGGAALGEVVSGFPLGSNTVSLRLDYIGGVATLGIDTVWGWWGAIAVRTVLMDKTGSEITTGYSTDTVLASQVVADLLGRRLNQFDRANATIATTSLGIQQLAYMDGVTAEQVLEDLMRLEPAYRWYTTPDTTGGGYGFRWELWPTTVRYEVTLDDGGSFPVSGQALFNEVDVHYTDIDGFPKIVTRTLACAILTTAGVTRRAKIDAGSEISGLSNAQALGDSFLADHNVPKNSGSIRIARPIRDVISGRMVDPWEIEAGELIRVRGVESYASSLNASDSDGQTVFRIWSMDYTSADNSANLALDADPADLTSALVALLNQRARG